MVNKVKLQTGGGKVHTNSPYTVTSWQTKSNPIEMPDRLGTIVHFWACAGLEGKG
jgi:hypothetical protein